MAATCEKFRVASNAVEHVTSKWQTAITAFDFAASAVSDLEAQLSNDHDEDEPLPARQARRQEPASSVNETDRERSSSPR